VIGSKYSQVTAGAAAVALNVDGTAIAIPTQTLTAGADYTLLFWNDTNGTQATLINDANRLPTTTGKVKLRLMNGMSALAVPATLAVDFAPIAEGVALGQAAAFTEIDAGTDYQFDVTNTGTSASLLTRDAVTLQDAGIYTLFMWGGGATPVSGTLRKDR
jgi:cytolysin (calcineurin-like family phosphatase)